MNVQTANRNFLRGRALEKRCAELRRDGKDAIRIAQELDLSVRRVHTALVKHQTRNAYLYEDEAAVERRADLDRLNEYTQALHPRAIGEEWRMVPVANGNEVAVRDLDYEAIKLVLEVSKRRAAILGYDAPKKTVGDLTVRREEKLDLSKLDDAQLIQMQELLEQAAEDEKNKTAIPVSRVLALPEPADSDDEG